MKFYIALGNKIKELRESKGISQADLALKLDYKTDTAIYLLEKGERKLPLDKFKKLAEIFEVPVSDLIGEEKDKTRVDIKTALRAENISHKDINEISNFIDFIKSKSESKSNSDKVQTD